jgi:hypothetical protein
LSDIVMLPLDKVVLCPEVQPRCQLDAGLVGEYAEDLARPDVEFPPVLVYRVEDSRHPLVDGRHLLVDGWHRYHAHRRDGRKYVAAVVRQGTFDGAKLAAAANSDHGLRRSPADRRRSVWLALQNPLTEGWTTAQIARHCRVSEPLVRALRMSFQAKPQQPDQDDEETTGLTESVEPASDTPTTKVEQVAEEAEIDLDAEDRAELLAKVARLLRKLDRLARLLETDSESLLRRYRAGQITTQAGG